jgi:hypothetical protein
VAFDGVPNVDSFCDQIMPDQSRDIPFSVARHQPADFPVTVFPTGDMGLADTPLLALKKKVR